MKCYYLNVHFQGQRVKGLAYFMSPPSPVVWSLQFNSCPQFTITIIFNSTYTKLKKTTKTIIIFVKTLVLKYGQVQINTRALHWIINETTNGIACVSNVAIFFPGHIFSNFCNRPAQVMRVPGRWGTQMPRKSAHEGGEVVSSTYRPGKYSWYSFLLEAGWIMSMKNLKTTTWIEPAIFRLVAQMSQPSAPPCAPNLEITGEKRRKMVMNSFVSV